MDGRSDTFAWLGLSADTGRDDIDDALRRVEWRATMLADQSPDRARALLARVREVRRDLLGEDEIRDIPDMPLQATSDTWSMRVGPAPQQPSQPVAPPAGRHRRWITGGLDAAVAATVILAILGALVHPWPGGASSPRGRLAAAVPIAGSGHPYRSGRQVTLRWSSVPGAEQYRLELAHSSTLAAPDTIIDEAGQEIRTTQTRYVLRVVGPRFYYWRVRAIAGSTRTRRSSAQVFSVDRPRPGIPLPRRSSIVAPPGRVQLCWSSVSGTQSYLLWLHGHTHVVAARHSCLGLLLSRGRYRWAVAARVQGVRNYAGPYSPKSTVVVRRPRPVARRHAHRSSRRAIHQGTRPVTVAAAHPAVPPAQSSPASSYPAQSYRAQSYPARSLAIATAPTRVRNRAPVSVARTPAPIRQPTPEPRYSFKPPTNTYTYGHVHRASEPPVTDQGTEPVLPLPPAPPPVPKAASTPGAIPPPPPPPPVP